MDITVKQKDAVNLIIECEKSIAKELSQYFTFYVPNYQYTPAYKKKIWDGQIRLFNVYGRTLYVGLLEYLEKFALDRKYTIEIDSENLLSAEENSISLDNFSDFIKSLDLNLKPHSHQLKASFHALNKKRTLLLSPTGSGKSLIIYILVKYCLKYLGVGEQILIVVPTIGLVNQLYADFVEYSNKTWDVDANVHKIFSGEDKQSQKKIVVSTWQSLYNMPNDFFSTFSCVFGDECHLFKAKSLTGLMTKLSNAHFRVGTTGTLDGTLTHKLVIEGLFGPVYNVTSTKKLIDKNLLSDIEIKCLMLGYSEKIRNEMKRSEYQDEIKFLISNEKRNAFIENLTLNLNGNSLVLFNYVDLHGKVLYENIKKKEPNRKVFFIYGGTDADQREEIRHILNKEKNAILIASYGTCSTGINIPSINNVIFASPSKSVIRVLQSIGRGIRKTKDKKKTYVYDISDDLTYKSYVNHTMKHLDERIKIYTKEKFKYKITRITI
jgi:superfamily II DNA or RNA helicase